jgi:4-amino-4-deoxy-L-arabinose transferase-like glycosyltransferase
LPASKVLFSGYFLGLLLLVYAYLVQKQVTHVFAGLSTLFLAATPLIFQHATIAYANLPLTFYIVAGVLLLTIGMDEPVSPSTRGKCLLSGMLFASACWTRPEGLVVSLVLIGFILGVVYLKRWRALDLASLAFLLAPLAVYELFWAWLKNQVYPSQAAKAGLVADATGQVLRGNLHLTEALYVVRSAFLVLFTWKDWGVLGIGVALAVGLALFVPAWRRLSPWLILLSGLVYLGAIIGVYYITSYDTTRDISWWVNTGLDRMMLPGVILLWVGGISSVRLFYKRDRIG